MHIIVQQIYKNLGIHYIYVPKEEMNVLQHTTETTNASFPKSGESMYATTVKRNDSLENSVIEKSTHQSGRSKKVTAQHNTSYYTKVDIEIFDKRFKNLCSTMKRTPCVWTYFTLGEDMFGTPNVQRRNTIKQMLVSLAMPQGTYSFVPFTAPNEDGSLTVYKTEFMGILQIYKPSLVLFFGKDSLEHIGISSSNNEWQEFIVFPPIRGIILPSIINLDIQGELTIIRYLKEYTKNIGFAQ